MPVPASCTGQNALVTAGEEQRDLSPTSPVTVGKPPASSDEVRRRMSLTPRRDTGPELAVRRALHRLGLRYRVDAPVPGVGVRRRADLIFGPARVAVFIDGCFWHACPDHLRPASVNGQWWAEKLANTAARDRDTDERIRCAGWLALRFWEHEDPELVAGRIATEVRRRRQVPGS